MNLLGQLGTGISLLQGDTLRDERGDTLRDERGDTLRDKYLQGFKLS